MSNVNHVAIIMDGNGRWGIKKYKSRKFGHKQGIKTVEKIIEASVKKKIKHFFILELLFCQHDLLDLLLHLPPFDQLF